MIKRRSFIQSMMCGIASITGFGDTLKSKKDELYTVLPRYPYMNNLHAGSSLNLPAGSIIYKNYEDAMKVIRKTRYREDADLPQNFNKPLQRLSVFGVNVDTFIPTIHISSQEMKRADVQSRFGNITTTLHQKAVAAFGSLDNMKSGDMGLYDFYSHKNISDLTTQILSMPKDEGLLAVKYSELDLITAFKFNLPVDPYMLRMFRQLKDIQDHFLYGKELLPIINFV